MDKKSQEKALLVERGNIRLVITHDSVEPELLTSEVVKSLSEGYGVEIAPLRNGVAEVSWMLKPYRYSEPDYGVPGWQRDCIAYAMIDEAGRFLLKFQYTDYYGLLRMHAKAERMIPNEC